MVLGSFQVSFVLSFVIPALYSSRRSQFDASLVLRV
jgi:hypothetical protein